MNKEIFEIVENSKKYGWILEHDSKKILNFYNIKTPNSFFIPNIQELEKIKEKIKFPVVLKVVSPKILHKSDLKGVSVGITDFDYLNEEFKRLISLNGAIGVIIEEMVEGVELIVGAKNDYQFGPVVIVGYGGVGVEIYKDTSMRMAPITNEDVLAMLKELKCFPILKGFRGKKGINLNKLTALIVNFSNFIMDFEDFFDSIDLNPVICNESEAFVCDARIILKK